MFLKTLPLSPQLSGPPCPALPQEWVRLQHHVCTEPYRSPEASTDGGMIYGYAADMWGVGLVITELAAGRPCYHRWVHTEACGPWV